MSKTADRSTHDTLGRAFAALGLYMVFFVLMLMAVSPIAGDPAMPTWVQAACGIAAFYNAIWLSNKACVLSMNWSPNDALSRFLK